jgi:ATP-dependent DNA helicase RecG
MTEEELLKIIDNLKVTGEIPYVEAKSNLSDIHKIGKTISAISNSASWKDQEYGYFIWGLKDKTWDIMGTEFKLEKIKEGNLDGNLWLKERGFNYKCDFLENEFKIKNNRIYVLKIKNCGNEPLYFFHKDKQAWIAHIREGQNDDELKNFPERLKYICSKRVDYDWSAQICEGATVEDLDLEAVEIARNGYLEKQRKLKNQAQIDVLAAIDLEKDPKKFLKYAKMLTKNGDLTNGCMLLLGKDKSVVNCGFAGEIGYVEKTFGIKEIYSVPFQKAIINVVNKISIKNIESYRLNYLGNTQEIISFCQIIPLIYCVNLSQTV